MRRGGKRNNKGVGFGREMPKEGVGRETSSGRGGERWGETQLGGGVERETSRETGGERNVKGKGREQVSATIPVTICITRLLRRCGSPLLCKLHLERTNSH